MAVTVEAARPWAQLANIELRQLRYFLAVAEELNFRRAAERLYVTQPTISRQIVQLEHEVGVRLLDRDRRRVTLTPAGSVLLESAGQALAHLERSLADTRGAVQRATLALRVGYVPYDAASLAPLLDAFRTHRADVWLDEQALSTAAQIEALWRRQLDVGFIRGAVDGVLTATTLQPRPRFLALALPRPHPLAGIERVPLRALAGERLLMPPRLAQPGHWCRVIALCQAAGFEPRIVECEGADESPQSDLVPMVAAGRGVCLLTCPLPGTAAHVVVRAVEPPVMAFDLALAWRTEDRSELVEGFVGMVAGMVPP